MGLVFGSVMMGRVAHAPQVSLLVGQSDSQFVLKFVS